MAQAIELTLRIEGRHLTVLRLQEVTGAAAGAAPAEAAIDLDNRVLLDWVLSLATAPSANLRPNHASAISKPSPLAGCGQSGRYGIAISVILETAVDR